MLGEFVFHFFSIHVTISPRMKKRCDRNKTSIGKAIVNNELS
jgi:hypothetical protein